MDWNLRNDDIAIYIVSDMVTKLEEEIQDVEYQRPREESAADDVVYGEAQEDLAIFDQRTNREKAGAINQVKCSDK